MNDPFVPGEKKQQLAIFGIFPCQRVLLHCAGTFSDNSLKDFLKSVLKSYVAILNVRKYVLMLYGPPNCTMYNI